MPILRDIGQENSIILNSRGIGQENLIISI